MANRAVSVFFFLMLFMSVPAGAQFNRTCSIKDVDVNKYCNEFIEKYGFFVTDSEMKDLLARNTIKSVDDFINEFWSKRDTDPNTSENEFKTLIDNRLRDIENEILASDLDTPGIRFYDAGGLRGDMAHVYLFYGMPHLKRKLFNMKGLVAEMNAWYYFDDNGKILFSFLFLNKYGRVILYDRHGFSVYEIVRTISTLINPSQNDMEEIIDYLTTSDPEGIFTNALFQFSYYSDVTLARALEAPEPASFIADRNRPTALGQPEISPDRKFIYGDLNSSIKANLDIVGNKTNNISFELLIKYSGIDWEIKDDRGVVDLSLRFSIQNKANRSVSEFESTFSLNLDMGLITSSPESYLRVNLEDLKNFRNSTNPEGTLKDIFAGLNPGEYIVNIDLRNVHTKKYISWQEVIIKE